MPDTPFARHDRRVTRGLAAALALGGLLAAASLASAQQPNPLTPETAPEGWTVIETAHDFETLTSRLEEAVRDNDMGLVTRASASAGAAGQGIEIPGNLVVGVFRNDFARRMLAASIPAGIEAPIRFYLTEDADGSATLSYEPPSVAFGPYMQQAAPDLRDVATELDEIFAAIATQATSDATPE